MVSPAGGSITWKHTIDGQWQPFTNLQSTVSTGAQIYKPSAITLQQKSKCVDIGSEEKKLTKSTMVWTPKGYGTITDISQEEEKEKIKVKTSEPNKQEGENEEHTFPSEEVRKKIEIKVRILNGAKLDWIAVKISINSKIVDLSNLISSTFEKSSYFINLFYNGKVMDKKGTLQEYKVGHLDTIMATLNSGTPKVFKRYRDISTSYWYVASSWDAIMFNCEKALIVMGFGVFKHYYTDNFEIRYKIFKEDEEVVTETTAAITPGMLKDKVGPVKLKNPVTIPAKTNFTVMYIYSAVSGQSSHAHYGQDGSNPCDIEGNEKIFEVIYSSRDQNGTSVETGQIPELHYIAL